MQLHQAPMPKMGILKLKKLKQTVEVSDLLNSFLKHEVC